MQICRDSCLRIVNGRLGDDAGIGNYTFQSVQGCSLIDYVLFPPTLFDIISKFTIHDISIYSDHAPIQFPLLSNVKSTVQEEQSEVTKIVWDSSKLNEFRDVLNNKLECLDSYVNNIVSDNANIDTGVQNFAETLYTCAFQVFGRVKRINTTQTTRKYTSPWFTVDCETARAELKRANKLFRKYRTQVLHEAVVEKRKQYRKITRHARFIYNRNKKIKLHELAKKNPKAVWQEIRRMKGSAENQHSVSVQDFFEHFKVVYSENSSQDFVEQFVHNQFDRNDGGNQDNELHYDTSSLDSSISLTEVKKAISKLKRNKSPGCDLLPPELFLDSIDLIGDVLCKLFNYIFDNAIYPECWTKGIIVPVPKKGDLSNVNNYRRITLTSIFSKIYSHILEGRSRTWSENNNIIDDCQFGFRSGKVHQIVYLFCKPSLIDS